MLTSCERLLVRMHNSELKKLYTNVISVVFQHPNTGGSEAGMPAMITLFRRAWLTAHLPPPPYCRPSPPTPLRCWQAAGTSACPCGSQ